MKLFGSLLPIILAAGNATGFAQTNPAQTNTPEASASTPISWGDKTWHLRSDPVSGALFGIDNGYDQHHMEWLCQHGHWDKSINRAIEPNRKTFMHSHSP